jgi:hypothetical protein
MKNDFDVIFIDDLNRHAKVGSSSPRLLGSFMQLAMAIDARQSLPS